MASLSTPALAAEGGGQGIGKCAVEIIRSKAGHTKPVGFRGQVGCSITLRRAVIDKNAGTVRVQLVLQFMVTTSNTSSGSPVSRVSGIFQFKLAEKSRDLTPVNA